jgi:hypothetical protein
MRSFWLGVTPSRYKFNGQVHWYNGGLFAIGVDVGVRHS